MKVPGDNKKAERYVKGIHEPIVSEAEFWVVQEMLGIKKPSKTQLSSKFPLRGLLNCECGQRMTAGFSKGKKSYYLYYRCIHHTSINLSGITLHEKFQRLLDELSFTADQIEKLKIKVDNLLKTTLIDNEKILLTKNQQLLELDKKIEELEESYFNKEIELSTYKRWFAKHTSERGHVLAEISKASSKKTSKWERLSKHLPRLSNLGELYRKARTIDQHRLVRGVFKHNFIYSDGAFRTPSINEIFFNNYLNSMKKGCS